MPQSESDHATTLLSLLKEKSLFLVVVEIGSEGSISAALRKKAKGSDHLRGSIVGFSTDEARFLFTVDPELMSAHGLHSDEVVRHIAHRTSNVCDANFILAVIAADDGGEGAAEAGTLHVAVARQGYKTLSSKQLLEPGTRISRRNNIIDASLLFACEAAGVEPVASDAPPKSATGKVLDHALNETFPASDPVSI